jgi:hypothetical protein
LRVATEIEHIFCFLNRAAEKVQHECLSLAWNFRSIEYHHALYLNLRLWPDYGRGPLGQVSKSRFSGFFIITMKFRSIEHNHAIYWKFGTLAELRSRPQAQMTIGVCYQHVKVLQNTWLYFFIDQNRKITNQNKNQPTSWHRYKITWICH